jgi:hypothetical protein
MNAWLFAIIFNGAWFGWLCFSDWRGQGSFFDAVIKLAFTGNILGLSLTVMVFIMFACCVVTHATDIEDKRWKANKEKQEREEKEDREEREGIERRILERTKSLQSLQSLRAELAGLETGEQTAPLENISDDDSFCMTDAFLAQQENRFQEAMQTLRKALDESKKKKEEQSLDFKKCENGKHMWRKGQKMKKKKKKKTRKD